MDTDTDTDTDITMVHLQLMEDTILMTTSTIEKQAFLENLFKKRKK